MRLSEALKAAGVELPKPAAPVASYLPAVYGPDASFGQPRTVFTSGQLPLQDGNLMAVGLVGNEADCDVADATDLVDPETAAACARQCAINALAAAAALVGDVDRIVGVVRVHGFVASAPGFNGQAAVLNGASDFFGELFGNGLEANLELDAPTAHARSAVGVAQLPLAAPVEVEVEFLLDNVR